MSKIYQLLKSGQGKAYQLGILPANPKKLNIFTSDRCNFSCWYCSRNVPDDSPDALNRYDDKSEFEFNDLKFLLDRYPSIKSVSYVGIGEPFLCKDLIPMAEYSKSLGKRNSIITNGSLMHNFWGQIAKLFDGISISLHGLSRDELQSIAKVKGKVYDQFIENVHYLLNEERKLNPDLEVRSSVVVLKNNMERVREAAQFCYQNGIPVLDLQNFLPMGIESAHECIFDDEFEYIDIIRDLIDEYANKVKINAPILIKRDDKKLKWGCMSFFNYLRVDGLGQVSGCGRIMSPAAENGNFHVDEDVFNNPYFISMRRKFRTRKDLPECCRYCPDAQ